MGPRSRWCCCFKRPGWDPLTGDSGSDSGGPPSESGEQAGPATSSFYSTTSYDALREELNQGKSAPPLPPPIPASPVMSLRSLRGPESEAAQSVASRGALSVASGGSAQRAAPQANPPQVKRAEYETSFAVLRDTFASCAICDASGAQQDVSMPKFFESCEQYRDILSKLGRAVGFVLADVDQNLGLAKQAWQEAPQQRATMKAYLGHDHAGVAKLMWLLRGLQFFLVMLQILFDPRSSGSGAASEAYTRTLAQYHGWAVQLTVKTAMRAMPGRDSIIASEGLCFGNPTPKQKKELIMRDGPLAADEGARQVDKMIQLFIESGKWDTSKA